MKKRRIGLRNIKTALSVMLCLVFDTAFGVLYKFLPSSPSVFYRILRVYISRNMSVYACIAAVIVMCSSLSLSRKSGVERVFGTFLGGAAGVLFIFVKEKIIDSNIILLPLGVVILIYFLTVLNKQEVVTVTLTVFFITMINSDSQPHIYVAAKVAATIFGTLVSLFVNRTIKKPYEVTYMKKNKTLIITIVCAAVILIGAIGGYAMYNHICYGPISTKETASIKTADIESSDDVYMIGHRGFSAIAPENTLEAFKEACENDFFGCEFDIHLTSDGQWVVMHDANIKRMTGVKGTIEEMTLEELKKIPFTNGANIGNYGEIYMPTLEETLELLSGYGVAPIIEIKTNTTEKLDEMLALIEKYDLSDKTWIISFEKEPLIKTREFNKDIKMSLLTHKVTQEDIDFCLENNMNGLDFSKKKAGAEQVKMITDAGLVPQVWTVDLIEDFEKFYSYGVRYFTGNCLTY